MLAELLLAHLVVHHRDRIRLRSICNFVMPPTSQNLNPLGEEEEEEEEEETAAEPFIIGSQDPSTSSYPSLHWQLQQWLHNGEG
eukprot:764760-Hanusia_phi.AAC.1